MDELMIYNYLKNMGTDNMNEHEFMDKFKSFMNKHKNDTMRHSNEGNFMATDDRYPDFYARRHRRPDGFMDFSDSDRNERFSDGFNTGRSEKDMYKAMMYMRHAMNEHKHFDESEAKYIVADMYHTENGRKYTGEKFDMYKAKEICERYRGVLPVSVTYTDVYIAINSQYHDYAELFKNWFGGDIEQKVIESAIVFWFKDIDSKSENKLIEYFREY